MNATTLPQARALAVAKPGDETVTLTYDERFLRRKVLTSDAGTRFLVDLDHASSLGQGDAFLLDNGRRVAVRPAPEALFEITADDLTRLAWHIGNRHSPCQIEPGRLLIRRDHVLGEMLEKLGATLRDLNAPFSPEGGAYGYGRTHGHDHGHGQGNDHEHGHGHGHRHGHDHAH